MRRAKEWDLKSTKARLLVFRFQKAKKWGMCLLWLVGFLKEFRCHSHLALQ